MLNYQTIIKTILTGAIFFMGVIALLIFLETGSMEMGKLFPPVIVQIGTWILVAMPSYLILSSVLPEKMTDKNIYFSAMGVAFVVYMVILFIFLGGGDMMMLKKVLGGLDLHRVLEDILSSGLPFWVVVLLMFGLPFGISVGIVSKSIWY